MLDPAHPQDSNEKSHRPLYHIAPSGGDHSTHLFNIFDNVVDTPSNGGGTYSAVWHVHAVFDKTKQGPPGGWPPDGLASFTSPTVSKVEDAIENDDDIYKFDFRFEFVCPVRPHDH